MDLYQGLATTRAIRCYSDEPVSDEEIERCFLAAVQAPSGGNIQPYQSVVVRDAALKQVIALPCEPTHRVPRCRRYGARAATAGRLAEIVVTSLRRAKGLAQ